MWEITLWNFWLQQKLPKNSEVNGSVKCKHEELDTRINDLESNLENTDKNVKMLKDELCEQEEIIKNKLTFQLGHRPIEFALV